MGGLIGVLPGSAADTSEEATAMDQPMSNNQPKHTTRSRFPLLIGGLLLSLIATTILGWWFIQRMNTDNDVQQFPDQGSGTSMHLAQIDSSHPAYNSNPPTSGWHYGGAVLTPGIYTEPVPDTITVHSLEHGMVIIHYRQNLDPDTIQQLTTLAHSLRRENPCLILLPRPVEQLDGAIAVTAWTYLLQATTHDSAAITTFFRERVGRGPEQVCPVGVAEISPAQP